MWHFNLISIISLDCDFSQWLNIALVFTVISKDDFKKEKAQQSLDIRIINFISGKSLKF